MLEQPTELASTALLGIGVKPAGYVGDGANNLGGS